MQVSARASIALSGNEHVLSSFGYDELLLLHAITNHHYIIKRMRVFLKLDAEIVTLHLHFLLNEANVADDESLAFVGINDEVAINVCNSVSLAALHFD